MKKAINIKQRLLLMATMCCMVTAQAQHYVPTDNNSDVRFKVVNHLLVASTVTGHLKNLEGTIDFYPADLEKSAFDVSVGVNTISTGIGMRDNHLKKEEFFNMDKYPRIRIRSAKISKGTAPGTYALEGTLTMKGVTKPVTISFITIPTKDGMEFKGLFHLKRLDYGVGEKGKIDNDVEVNLDVYTLKK